MDRGVPSDCYGVYGGPHFVDEYALYPPGGMRPDSICSVSGGFDRVPPHWTTPEIKRRSLRDGPLYPRGSQWGPPPHGQHPGGYYGQVAQAQRGMHRLSMQPRSRSVPRSPSSSSPQGPYSPMRSPSARFERDRDDLIYTDPSVYGLRRSVSSPKVPTILPVLIIYFFVYSILNILYKTQSLCYPCNCMLNSLLHCYVTLLYYFPIKLHCYNARLLP